LKHIYGGKWNNEKIIDRIKEVIKFNTNEAIIKLDEKLMSRLQEGSIYTYGFDRNRLPILIMRVDKIDFSKGL
jgi:hypothetical protein